MKAVSSTQFELLLKTRYRRSRWTHAKTCVQRDPHVMKVAYRP